MVATFPIVIEDMTLDDIDGVQEVERASFPVTWPANAFRHELTQNKNARYLVAREGDHIVGYAGLWLMVDAALTGLVVVALSLHAKAIMAHPLLRDRAFAAIVALMTQVFLAAAVLVPTQSSLALGLEVGLVAAFWLARSIWAIPYIRGNAARLRGRAYEYRRRADRAADLEP